MADESMVVIEKALDTAKEDITKQVKEITSALDHRLKAAEAQVADKGKTDEELKSEIKNLAQKHQEYTEAAEKKFAELQRSKAPASEDNGRPKSFIKHLHELFYEKGEGGMTIAERVKNNRSKQPIEFDLKAVGDLSASNLTGSYFIGYDVRPGIINPLQESHIRPIFPQGQTTKDTVRFARETGGEGAFTTVAAGGTKPQIDWDLQMYDAPVRKIAGYFRLPEEMMDDIPYLMSYLTMRGLEELRNVEDDQLLYGDGNGQNLTGIDTVATAFAAGALTVASANNFDVLVAAKKQLRKLNLLPNYILVSPEDYAKMRLAKGSDGHYIFPVYPGTDQITVDGTIIIQNNNVNDDDFYVLDTKWMQVLDRMAAQVRLFDQDRDNVIKNMVTCVIEERLAFPIYRPQAIVKGSFDDAIAALTA
ncbi:phage major capsid protein [Larkinella soli]|uniref:phage major capsid protein n=1 Tax=Larkinella soli TaxID=1770527 RepID=UPI000FFB11E8|nr:phage major capsid protein [Larkinella soli]